MRTLLVLGGTGVVGRRIARLARAHGVAERVLAGSRSARGADAIEVDLSDAHSLGRALRGVDAVINAVGPFEYDPRPLVRACAEHGRHYVDIAETERFIEAVRAEAQGASIAAVSGASTVPGLVTVLAQALASRRTARVRAYLSVGTGNEASTTLLASMLAPVGRRMANGRRAFDELVRVEHGGLGARVYGRYPSGADGSGISLGRADEASRVPLELYFGCDRALYARALGAAGLVLGRSRALATLAARATVPLVPLVRALGTGVGVLRVEAVGALGEALDAIEVRARREGLDVPALPAVWAASALKGRTGALRLCDLIEPRDAMARLEAAGFEVIAPGAAPAGREERRAG